MFYSQGIYKILHGKSYPKILVSYLPMKTYDTLTKN